MKCHACGDENAAESVYCVRCGAKLEAVCLHCAAHNPASDGFCGNCGRRLTPESAAQTATVEVDSGERRQLTVLFCDLVGSTELAARLDPEEYHEALNAYHR